MGQKVHPTSIRLKITRDWSSKWYARPREYAATLHEDLALRNTLMNSRLTKGGEISNIEIIRHPNRVSLIVHTARPGVVIGSKGENIEKISALLQKETTKSVQIKIRENKNPEKCAQIVAMSIARQLRQRSAFRRIIRIAIENAMKENIQGIRVKISGRLGGAEMSRSVSMIRGRMPLHTLRADIDYGFAESMTTYGTIGVKVWIFNKEIYKKNIREDAGLLIRNTNAKDKKERKVVLEHSHKSNKTEKRDDNEHIEKNNNYAPKNDEHVYE